MKAATMETSGPTTRLLSPELLHKMDAYWRAANYLSVGQIYLYDNPLLKEPLKLSHVKPLVVGHWGTTPGQNFIYVHLNRVIKKYDLDMFYIAGPGHGGPALVGNVYLEGTWSEIYPNVTQDEAGLKKLFKQFSFPGGISSHVAPTTPGSIHEGGELGYSLSHAFGAAFDNPDLDRRLRRRRRRGGNRPAGDRVAVEQAAQPDHRRRRAADPAPQRLQDQQPDRPGPDRARGAGAVLPRLRLDAVLRGGRRAGGDAPAHGRHPGHGHRGHPADPGQRAEQDRHHPAALADDRPAVAQGLDGAESRRRPADRGDVPVAPGAAPRGCRASRARPAARKLDEELQGRGAVRRERPARAGAGRAGAEGRPADGRQSARQRRPPAARPAHAGLPRPRGDGAFARRRRRPGHARAWAVPARRGRS